MITSKKNIPVLMAVTLLCLNLPLARAAEDDSPSLERNRFLLLDSRIIDSTENATLTLGVAQKSEANPLFEEDKPWEMRYDNLYANVMYDEEDGIFKCWYSPFIIDTSSKGMTLEEWNAKPYDVPNNREMAICYATSKDGITWEKPEMGLVEFEGSKANNILWRGSGDTGEHWDGPHGSGVFKDLHDPDPARRYKAFLKAEILSVAFSPDGIHWGDAMPRPEADSAGDTHNNALWAPTLGQYVGITREWGAPFGRQVARTTSDDFLEWTSSEVVLEGIDANFQTYAMPVFFHGGIYLGLAAIHDQTTDRVWTELTWSPDTIEWHRVSPGTPLIPNSEEERAYDWGCVYAGAYPVFLDDEIRIYYGGSDGLHTSWRNGYFCLATLRPDGFAGYTPETTGVASLTTTPITNQKGALQLSADVQDDGWVTVRVIDNDDNILAESAALKQSATDTAISWLEDFSIEEHGAEFRIKITFHNATVYSFSFDD